mmetsp:Transcript_7784/g.19086  ORF Transcript_7784/g.19086 Transcript_7784/m.19086 type:complete len:157 (+) Transcript_7784:1000-1470(+)
MTSIIRIQRLTASLFPSLSHPSRRVKVNTIRQMSSAVFEFFDSLIGDSRTPTRLLVRAVSGAEAKMAVSDLNSNAAAGGDSIPRSIFKIRIDDNPSQDPWEGFATLMNKAKFEDCVLPDDELIEQPDGKRRYGFGIISTTTLFRKLLCRMESNDGR